MLLVIEPGAAHTYMMWPVQQMETYSQHTAVWQSLSSVTHNILFLSLSPLIWKCFDDARKTHRPLTVGVFVSAYYANVACVMNQSIVHARIEFITNQINKMLYLLVFNMEKIINN